jgi:hypothetical protein
LLVLDRRIDERRRLDVMKRIRKAGRTMHRVRSETHPRPNPDAKTRSQEGSIHPHRRGRMLERESDEMLGV